MTPRQLEAFHFFAHKRRTVEQGELLSLQTLAARGDPRTVKKTIKELTRD